MKIELGNATVEVVMIIVVIIAFLLLILGNLIVKRRSQERESSSELKMLPSRKLEKMVFRYETDYFNVIGEENKSVHEFRKLIENEDILTLNKKSSTLMRTFLKLEKKSSYKGGRPLLMEYYFNYELYVRELYRRRRSMS